MACRVAARVDTHRHRAVNDATERALAPLVGMPMWGAVRDRELLVVQFGARRAIDDAAGSRDAGELELRVSCAWRLMEPTGIAAASGDLFTPADPEAELETFDWEAPGSSWLDVRLQELAGRHAKAPPVISTFVTDGVGGFRLVLTEGVELEVFPNSSAAEHVETEFWRVSRPGEDDAQVVVSTAGVVLVEGEERPR
jgi:hypothetical protein